MTDEELETWELEAKQRTVKREGYGLPYPPNSLGFIMSDRTIQLIDELRKAQGRIEKLEKVLKHIHSGCLLLDDCHLCNRCITEVGDALDADSGEK